MQKLPWIDYPTIAYALPQIYARMGYIGAWRIYQESTQLLVSDEQQAAIYQFFREADLNWNWGREAGKTEKMSTLPVFGCLVQIDCYWIAATTNQTLKAQKYWNDNPFCKPASVSKHRAVTRLINGSQFELAVATNGNVRGPHVKWCFYDEVALIDDDVWTSSLGITSGKESKRLYSSTPIEFSLFRKTCDNYSTCVITYLQCGWLDQQRILGLRKIMGEAKWLQEYMAVFTVLNGRVFQHNIVEFSGNPPDCTMITQGVDFGGSKPHTLVRKGFYNGKFYILGEWAFDPADPHAEAELTKISKMFPTEKEMNGPGIEKSYLVPMGIEVYWNEQNKYERLNMLLRSTIAINPDLTPNTFKDFCKAQYDEKGKVDTSALDYLAAGMHAFLEGDPIVDIPSQQPERRRYRYV